MSEVKDAAISIEGTESTKDTEEVVKDTISVEEFEDLKKTLKSVKSAQQGVDRTNTVLREQLEEKDKELEAQKKTSMSGDELLAFEKEKSELAQRESKAELDTLKKATLVKDFLLEKGLNKKFEKYFKGDSFEELEQEATELLTDIDTEVERRVKEKLVTPIPNKATSEQPPTDTSKMTYAELVRHNQSNKK